MAKLKFKKSEVAALLTNLKADSKLMLVGDEGVYLMSFDQEVGQRQIIFAEGCNPNKDPDWYDKKGEAFGYDDGGDPIGTAKELVHVVVACKHWVYVNITPTSLRVSNR